MARINWLHLSDLHLGSAKSTAQYLWPDIQPGFFSDLDYLIDTHGPIDFVLFTGDLTQCGKSDEFAKVNQFVDELNVFFAARQGINGIPPFLAVPGNHDLMRPADPSNAVVMELTKHYEEDDLYHGLCGSAGHPNLTINHISACPLRRLGLDTGRQSW